MYKKIFIFLMTLFGCFQVSYANVYIEKYIDEYKIKVIRYNIESKDYNFTIGINPDFQATGLRELMEVNNGISAINGVFFCPESYGECGGKNFTHNERYKNGLKVSGTGSVDYRVVFALDRENNPFLFQTDTINPEKEVEIFNGLGNFPLLLLDGEKKIQDYIDADLLSPNMKTRIPRNFICIDNESQNIYTGYVYNISLEQIGDVLLKLGCENAINLDAGGSSAMIYNARHIIGPGRKILDGIIIERKGLNTQKIREIGIKIINNIDKKLLKSKYETKIEYLDILSQGLKNIRVKLYERNSRDIVNGFGEVLGYEIYMNKIKDLEAVYLINYLDVLIYNLQQRYIEEENIINPPIREYSF